MIFQHPSAVLVTRSGLRYYGVYVRELEREILLDVLQEMESTLWSRIEFSALGFATIDDMSHNVVDSDSSVEQISVDADVHIRESIARGDWSSMDADELWYFKLMPDEVFERMKELQREYPDDPEETKMQEFIIDLYHTCIWRANEEDPPIVGLTYDLRR